MMKTKIFMTIIIMLVVNLAFAPYTYASGNTEKEAKFAKKVKTEIAKLGVGKDARIKIKLKDGTKLNGYISEIKDNEFSVTNSETGTTTTVQYANAKQVKGNNLSSGTIITIAFVAGLLAIALIVAYSAN